MRVRIHGPSRALAGILLFGWAMGGLGPFEASASADADSGGDPKSAFGKSRHDMVVKLLEGFRAGEIPVVCEGSDLYTGEERLLCECTDDRFLLIEFIGPQDALRKVSASMISTGEARDVILGVLAMMGLIAQVTRDKRPMDWLNAAMDRKGEKSTLRWGRLAYSLSVNVNGLGFVILTIEDARTA